MSDNLPVYQGYFVRHPAPDHLAISPQDFGYMDLEDAERCRKLRQLADSIGHIHDYQVSWSQGEHTS